MTSLIARVFPQVVQNIDDRLARELGYPSMASFGVHTKEFPHYRFVDLYRTVEEYCKSRSEVMTIDSEQEEDLNSLLHGKRKKYISRRIKRSRNTAWPVGPAEEVYLPVDRFWLCKPSTPQSRDRLIFRLRYDEVLAKATLEVASEDPSFGESCLTRLAARSVENSVYRNRLLELTFESGAKDQYGDIERTERFRVMFKATEPVGDEDIVIDEEVRETLRRNVIDLHLKRDMLKAHHVPIRRGVLLYGPPGTGKTFACRYLCGKLPNITRIVATGAALLQVNSIFSLARTLQPSLVILEDVDLVFSSREVNLYSSVLGDLLDQMDGLRPHEDIGFILTTNSIDRMEAAIKDRPGRISQCIYFGAPKAELRKRYLLHYLQRYKTSALDVDKLVAESDGATQAFLKEWVHRSVQIATERLASQYVELELQNEDFREAMREMRRFSEGSTGRIIGFHTA
jgi:AAA+ superfamily predicted ATPase